jgi:hypothetical protein
MSDCPTGHIPSSAALPVMTRRPGEEAPSATGASGPGTVAAIRRGNAASPGGVGGLGFTTLPSRAPASDPSPFRSPTEQGGLASPLPAVGQRDSAPFPHALDGAKPQLIQNPPLTMLRTAFLRRSKRRWRVPDELLGVSWASQAPGSLEMAFLSPRPCIVPPQGAFSGPKGPFFALKGPFSVAQGGFVVLQNGFVPLQNGSAPSQGHLALWQNRFFVRQNQPEPPLAAPAFLASPSPPLTRPSQAGFQTVIDQVNELIAALTRV